MAKSNYLVSNLRELWDSRSKDIFISDPYIEHVLHKDKMEKSYHKYEVAEHIRKNAEDLEQHDNYVDEKYKKYLKIISERLNKIHDKNYNYYFWQKALSLGLIRYITSLHNSFFVHEKYYNDANNFAKIIPEENYFCPNSFEELRQCLQNSDYGQELMFSMYVKVKGYNSCKHQRVAKFGIKKKLSVLNSIKKQLKYLLYRYLNRPGKIVILGSYFKKLSFRELKSHGINQIILPQVKNKTDSINKHAREYISEIDDEFDDFDKYFFFSLKYLLPKIFLENFEKYERTYLNYLKQFPSLKFIVSENYISNTENSFCLALADTLGIKHIANEHNCLYHPFVGSYIDNVIDLCDIYLTIGWSNTDNSKVISSSSLFNFHITPSTEKNIDLLFISGAVLSKMQHYCGAYGYCQENAESNISFNKSFLSYINLKNDLKLVYREYPKHKLNHLQVYDKEFYYSQYINNFHYTDTSQITSKEQISKSKLVVIDYISTSFIESLIMDVPTIFFLDKKSYHLKNEYSLIFDELIDVNICQTDPIKAATFVQNIIHNPDDWWNDIKVISAKENFIQNNINTGNELINYLKNL